MSSPANLNSANPQGTNTNTTTDLSTQQPIAVNQPVPQPQNTLSAQAGSTQGVAQNAIQEANANDASQSKPVTDHKVTVTDPEKMMEAFEAAAEKNEATLAGYENEIRDIKIRSIAGPILLALGLAVVVIGVAAACAFCPPVGVSIAIPLAIVLGTAFGSTALGCALVVAGVCALPSPPSFTEEEKMTLEKNTSCLNKSLQLFQDYDKQDPPDGTSFEEFLATCPRNEVNGTFTYDLKNLGEYNSLFEDTLRLKQLTDQEEIQRLEANIAKRKQDLGFKIKQEEPTAKLDRLNKELDKANKELAAREKEIRDNRKAQGELSKDFREVGRSLQDTQQQLDKLMQSSVNPILRKPRTTDEVNQNIDAIENKIQKAKDDLRKAGVSNPEDQNSIQARKEELNTALEEKNKKYQSAQSTEKKVQKGPFDETDESYESSTFDENFFNNMLINPNVDVTPKKTGKLVETKEDKELKQDAIEKKSTDTEYAEISNMLDTAHEEHQLAQIKSLTEQIATLNNELQIEKLNLVKNAYIDHQNLLSDDYSDLHDKTQRLKVAVGELRHKGKKIDLLEQEIEKTKNIINPPEKVKAEKIDKLNREIKNRTDQLKAYNINDVKDVELRINQLKQEKVELEKNTPINNEKIRSIELTIDIITKNANLIKKYREEIVSLKGVTEEQEKIIKLEQEIKALEAEEALLNSNKVKASTEKKDIVGDEKIVEMPKETKYEETNYSLYQQKIEAFTKKFKEMFPPQDDNSLYFEALKNTNADVILSLEDDLKVINNLFNKIPEEELKYSDFEVFKNLNDAIELLSFLHKSIKNTGHSNPEKDKILKDASDTFNNILDLTKQIDEIKDSKSTEVKVLEQLVNDRSSHQKTFRNLLHQFYDRPNPEEFLFKLPDLDFSEASLNLLDASLNMEMENLNSEVGNWEMLIFSMYQKQENLGLFKDISIEQINEFEEKLEDIRLSILHGEWKDKESSAKAEENYVHMRATIEHLSFLHMAATNSTFASNPEKNEIVTQFRNQVDQIAHLNKELELATTIQDKQTIKEGILQIKASNRDLMGKVVTDPKAMPPVTLTEKTAVVPDTTTSTSTTSTTSTTT